MLYSTRLHPLLRFSIIDTNLFCVILLEEIHGTGNRYRGTLRRAHPR